MNSVDVAIPNFNYGRYLRECVTSVLRQPIDNLRVLIIDNASTDDSAEIAQELAAEDPRIELRLRNKNLGPHASFNEGIDWAKAEYFLVLCSDDLLMPNALAHAARFMEKQPNVHLAYGATWYCGGDIDLSRQPGSETLADWTVADGRAFIRRVCEYGRNPLTMGPTNIVRTEVQKKVGYYSSALTHTDDLEMWLRLALHGAVAETSTCQSIARIHGQNQSAALRDAHQWNLEYEATFNSFFAGDGGAMDDAGELRKLARRALSDRAYWCAVARIVRREPGVRDLLSFAFRLRPTAAVFPPLTYLRRRPDALARVRRALAS